MLEIVTIDGHDHGGKVGKKLQEVLGEDLPVERRSTRSMPLPAKGTTTRGPVEDLLTQLPTDLVAGVLGVVLGSMWRRFQQLGRDLQSLTTHLREQLAALDFLNFEIFGLAGWRDWQSGASNVIKVLVRDRENYCEYAVYVLMEGRKARVGVVKAGDIDEVEDFIVLSEPV